ncbi:MAG: hypothetical protein LIP01_08465 [Tannerellaceae bacterium]|nr:hypothetical protein [Tannerellaceae bacterium]
MKILIHILFFLLIPLFTIQASPSIAYTPQIKNYSVNDYKAGNQNWAVAQDKNGIIYFANNRGLLVFDGIRWKLYTLPNNISIRSLYVGEGERIYIGAFEEFGYFEKETEKGLTYHSLKAKIPHYNYYNEEIWTIHEYANKIIFQSFSSWYVFDGETIERHEWEYPLLYFFTLQNRLFVQFMNGDFCEYKEAGFTTLFTREKVQNDDVVGILPKEEQLLIVTASHGLYLYEEGNPARWGIPVSTSLAASTANRTVSLGDSIYIIGTILDGLYAIDQKGELLWHINRENNLINNTVLGLHTDTNGNLWSALDNGVALIRTQSPIYQYEPFEAQIGMVHDITFKDDNIYFATNQGVYIKRPTDKQPQLIAGTNEQTWYITVIDNQIIAGHNKGTLLIEGDKAYRMEGPNGGGTAIRKCILHGKEVLLQVSYTSMSIFIKDDKGKWIFSHNVEGFNNLIKSLEIDHTGNIWAGHMFKGCIPVAVRRNTTKSNRSGAHYPFR